MFHIVYSDTDSTVKYRKTNMYRGRVAKVVTVKDLLFSWKRIGVAAKFIEGVKLQHPGS